MGERDLFFLVMIAIVSTTLVVFLVQFVRSRRSRDDERGGNWWEGPWDEDDRR